MSAYKLVTEKRRIYHREYRKKNRDKINTYIRDHRKKNRYRYYINGIRRIYKIDESQYNKIVKNQNNECAICCKKFSWESKNNKPYIDHDHKTGKIRGLLCRNCNAALGMFDDNLEIIDNAKFYLEYNLFSKRGK